MVHIAYTHAQEMLAGECVQTFGQHPELDEDAFVDLIFMLMGEQHHFVAQYHEETLGQLIHNILQEELDELKTSKQTTETAP